jgi:membrane protein involved in colicin uptake
VLKRRNDAKKKQKIEADKAKAREENEVKAKAEAEEKSEAEEKDEAKEKDVAEKEKELAEVARVATKLAEKEAVDKVVEEERQKKNTDDREGDTHPMDLDIPGTSTTGTGAETMSSGLGLGPWEPFRSAEILDL